MVDDGNEHDGEDRFRVAATVGAGRRDTRQCVNVAIVVTMGAPRMNVANEFLIGTTCPTPVFAQTVATKSLSPAAQCRTMSSTDQPVELRRIEARPCQRTTNGSSLFDVMPLMLGAAASSLGTVWAFDIFSDTNMTALEDFVKHRLLKHPVDQRKSIGLEIGETKSEHSGRLQRLRESGVAIYINDDGAPKPPGQSTYGTDTDPLEERCFDTCGGFGFDSDDEVFS
ncbi:hypothetical protein EV122DRAFT_248672 [Schizophyllum commune]